MHVIVIETISILLIVKPPARINAQIITMLIKTTNCGIFIPQRSGSLLTPFLTLNSNDQIFRDEIASKIPIRASTTPR